MGEDMTSTFLPTMNVERVSLFGSWRMQEVPIILRSCIHAGALQSKPTYSDKHVDFEISNHSLS